MFTPIDKLNFILLLIAVESLNHILNEKNLNI